MKEVVYIKDIMSLHYHSMTRKCFSLRNVWLWDAWVAPSVKRLPLAQVRGLLAQQGASFSLYLPLPLLVCALSLINK